MSELINFEYELPGGGILAVHATVAPGRPMMQPSLNFPGEPAEGAEVEIIECRLKDPQDICPDLPFDPEGLFLRRRDGKFKQIEDDMEDYAIEAYEKSL
jgi:hypothetical protein